MKVTVRVELDDSTTIERTVYVDSGANQAFWAHGIETGTKSIVDRIAQMMSDEYGYAKAADPRLHVVSPLMR